MTKSNMYPEYQGKTINFIVGKCPHACKYCYVNDLPFVGELYGGLPRFNEKAFERNLGKNNFWFICSCNDICAVRKCMAFRILEHLNKSPSNTYLIQSKDPAMFFFYDGMFPPNTILGTTVETNRNYTLSNAPQPADRLLEFAHLQISQKTKKMVSIEPIMDFDLDAFVKMIKKVGPDYVSIGADSQNHNLPEPSKEKARALINELKKFTEVREKDNLKRITCSCILIIYLKISPLSYEPRQG